MQKYWWRQTEWHSKMDKSMQVNGMGESTREAYLRSMRMLVEHYDKAPDLITEEELLDYFHPPSECHRLEPGHHAHLLFRRQVLLQTCSQARLAPAYHRSSETGKATARRP